MRFDRKYIAGAAVLVLAVAAVGLTAFNGSQTSESPGTTYGFLPVSQDSGFLDLPALAIAGPSLGNDNPDKYTCWKDDFYVDQDGDRGVEYFDGENLDISPGEYYTGYEKTYTNAEICGGRYNYQCEMGSGCDGFVEDEPDNGNDGSDDEGDDSDSSEQEDTNQAPKIESIDTPSTVNTSTEFTVSVEASDPDDPSLSYSWSNGKTGDSIILNYVEPGVKELDVQVSDGEKTVSSTVRVNVVEPDVEEPVTDTIPNPVWSFWNWFTGLFS